MVDLPQPKREGHRRRQTGLRILLWLLLLGLAGALTVLWLTAGWNDPMTLLVLGSDTRSESAPGRSDTIFLLRADPKTRSLRGLSLPRDLYVPIRGLEVGMTNRINAALFFGDYYRVAGGGLKVARETISSLLETPVDGVIALGFPIVQDVMDSIGGVEVYVEHLVVERSFTTLTGGSQYTVRFEPGWNYLNGRRALEYVRLRKPDTDFGRMERNRQFFSAVLETVRRRLGLRQELRLLTRVYRRMRSDLGFRQTVRAARIFLRCADGPIEWHSLSWSDVEPWTTPQGAQVLLPRSGALERARDHLQGCRSEGVRRESVLHVRTNSVPTASSETCTRS